jgi:hypothetical protein
MRVLLILEQLGWKDRIPGRPMRLLEVLSIESDPNI